MLFSSIFFLGCAPGTLHTESQDLSDLERDTTEDDTNSTDTIEDVEGIPSDEDSCSDIYNQDILPTFSLDFEPSVWDQIVSACSAGSQTYFPVQFSYDGETVEAMTRLKGNWSWNCDKMQFVISFNEEDPDGRFHGLRKIVLDAPWYDHTLLHERLAFPLFKDRGLPYSCANNAKLMVNGEYYGLYANVERIDREYLERHFADPTGNLYQGGSELKTNEDVYDTSDIEALNAASTVEDIAQLVDLDQAVAEWSMEAMIPAMDNYWAGVEINYYLYNDPQSGFVYLPYDLDISFGDSAYSDGSLVWSNVASVDPITHEHSGWGKEVLVETVLNDPYWCTRFVQELALSREAFDPEALRATVQLWDAQIIDALNEDPNKTFSNERHIAATSQLMTFFDERADFVDGWLAEGGHCASSD